jgi:hypothetical protein
LKITYQGEEYVSGREAARMLDVKPATFRTKCYPYLKGKGQIYRIPGYSWEYFKKTEIEKYDGPLVVSRRRRKQAE